MENPATAALVTAAEYEVPEGTSAKRLQTWLDVAWRALQGEDSTLVDRLTAETVDQDTVVDVVTAAALRVLRNGDGVESEAEALDDYSYNRKKADATQDVYFTAAELRRIGVGGPATPPFTGSLSYTL